MKKNIKLHGLDAISEVKNPNTASRVNLKLNKKQPGYVAFITMLFVGAIGLAISVSLLLLGIGSTRTSFAVEQSRQARALSNACVQEALHQIKKNHAFTGTINLTINPGACSVTVTDLGGNNRQIDSSGTVGTIKRKEQLFLDSITPINITSWQEVADF